MKRHSQSRNALLSSWMPAATLVATLALVLGGPGHADAGTVTFSNPTVNSGGGRLYGSSQNFIEDDMWVEGFWFTSIGTPSGTATSGHFHKGTSNFDFERQHYQSGSNLQGLYIERADGQPFSVTSLDYTIRSTTSIDGFDPSDVNILVATSFDPTQTAASEFTAFSVGNTIGGPFTTLQISGFENVTQVFISSSASVDFDNIVPEPATLSLLAVGGLALIRRRRR